MNIGRIFSVRTWLRGSLRPSVHTSPFTIPSVSFGCSNPVWGVTTNIRDPTRVPGGSSGGEGVLIAAGGSPLGLGTDIGGSVRAPALFSGCCGFKPTSGRIR